MLLQASDIFIILILIVLLYKLSVNGYSYIFLSSLVLVVNLIGNLLLEESFLATTNLNFLLFLFLHLVSFNFFSKYNFVSGTYPKIKKSLLLDNTNILWFYFFVFLSLIVFLFYKVGIILYLEDLQESRTLLKYGSGFFSRIILHGLPIIAGIFFCLYFYRKKKYYLIIPALSLFIVLLTGYRGFIIWTLIYFLMISNGFKKIKIFNFKIWLGVLSVISFSVYLTKQYFINATYEIAITKFFERVLISNVYGYNLLINKYLKSNSVGWSDVTDLPSKLFAWEYGAGGILVELGSELTVTLPGMAYALGGYFLTGFFAILIGSISGSLVRKNLNSEDPTHIAVRTFILLSFITLINRGYIFNFLTISMTSIVFVYFLILIPSTKILRRSYL